LMPLLVQVRDCPINAANSIHDRAAHSTARAHCVVQG
jgi:hypothetical protein